MNGIPMADVTEVIIPLLNPNEPEALLAGLHVSEGQQVSAGEALCTLETTKSAADVVAEVGGYIAGLRFQAGQTLRAGERLCFLAPDPHWQPPAEQNQPALSEGSVLLPGLRITQPALALAKTLGLDLSRLPVGPLITETVLRELLEHKARPELSPPAATFDASAIIVYGGGGHGKSVIEMLRLLGGYRIAGVLDDGLPAGSLILDVPVLGGGEALPALYELGTRLAVNAVGGIGNVQVRIKIFERLAQAGFACPAVLHPTAFMEASAKLAPGVQVFPHAYVGSDARVGYGSIVNTGAVVSHDCLLGDYVNISPGALLAGGVQVGSATLVGMGATINLEAKIGAGARIGNGATVKSDVPAGGVVRAGSVWPA